MTLHLTSGDCAAEILRRAGLPGEVVGWRDSPAVGPSPGGLPFEDYRRLRAAFRGCDPASFQDTDRLAGLPPEEEVVLWLDACPYDQVLLLRLLDFFAWSPRRMRRLWLIEVGSFPGVEPFSGLGQLGPRDLAGLFPARRPVSAAQLVLAQIAWTAFGAPEPAPLVRLLAGIDTAALPFLAAALWRLLEEYPAVGDGLSRTERQALAAVAAGAQDLASLVEQAAVREGPGHGCWYGDSGLAETVARLAGEPAPLLAIEGGASPAGLPPGEGAARGGRLELTREGGAALAGELDWAAVHGLDRWIGGVHLAGTRPAWRWDRGRRSIAGVAP